MTLEPNTDATETAPSPKARLALAMDMEGLALMERTPVGWVRRGGVSLNDEDFPGRMAGLRDAALAMGGADGVEVWLPAEQILPLRVAPEAPGPVPFRAALAAATPHALEELTWDATPVEGGFIVAAAWRRTVREAREFAEKWDLPVSRVTTRAVDAEFPEGPVFEIAPPGARPVAKPPPGTASRKRPWAIGGAFALAALGFALWLWMAGAPDLPDPKAEWAPPNGLTALSIDEAADGASRQAVPPVAAPAPPVAPEARAPALERPPEATAPPAIPRAVPATGLGESTATDREPPVKSQDAPPNHAEAPAPGAAPAVDRAARLAVEPETPKDPATPPRAVIVRQLAPGVAPASADARTAAPAPNAPPTAIRRVSVLAEEPKGLADLTPPPEVMSMEFAPLAPPTDPEDLADEADAKATAADPPATLDESAPEIPAEHIASPDIPRPPAKPGDVADPKTAGTETAGTPPIPPTRPEDAPGAQPSPEPESLSGADEPSAHALAAAPRPLPKPVSAKDLVEAADLAPTALAAATAPRPVRKPAGLKRRAGALATARAAARDKARLAAKASDGKPVSGGRRQQIPASASLAAAATNRNAVDLSQTILVGVFGSPTSRRAILRLPSGDIRRVKKGESIEGWKVATIGQSSIKLTKSGKSQTLNVPGE